MGLDSGLWHWWGRKSLVWANKQHRGAVRVYTANTETRGSSYNCRLTIAKREGMQRSDWHNRCTVWSSRKTRRTVLVTRICIRSWETRTRVAQDHVGLYEGRRQKEREREYDGTYYEDEGLGLTSSTQWSAGQRYEWGARWWWPMRTYNGPRGWRGSLKAFKIMFS